MRGAKRDIYHRLLRKLLLIDRSLMAKLTVYSALLVVIPMTMAGYISYHESSRTLENEARSYSWQIIEQVKLYVEDYLRDYELNTLKIINHPDTVQLLRLHSMQESIDADVVPKVRNVLKNFAYSQSDITNITIVLDDMLSIHSAVLPDASSIEGIENEPWYETLSPAGPPQVYSRVIEWNERREPVISIVKRIVNPQTLQAYGMLVIDLNYKRMHETARGIRLGESGRGYLFITDERGRIVYHPEPSLIGTSASSSVSELLDESSGSFIANEEEEQLYTFSRSEKLGWQFITVIPYDELMSSRTYIGRTITAATAIFTVIALLFSLGLAAGIVRPIRRLYQYMRRVEIGDFKGQVPVESKDEIGMLSIGFNKMVVRLSQLLEEVYFSKLRETEMHLQQKESELKMLQAQMNPHFLYNSLDTIRGMALEHDRPEIGTMAASLARILRYNVKHPSAVVTVQREIEMVRVYLQIQQYRFEDRLAYEIEMPDWAYRQRIAKLTLQPLVENCIVHGLEHKVGMTRILLKAERVSELKFVIGIMDDGPGMSDEQLSELKMRISEGKVEDAHIGLMNVQRRIQHLFGSDCGLHIDSTKGRGTSVKIVLPYRPVEKEMDDAV